MERSQGNGADVAPQRPYREAAEELVQATLLEDAMTPHGADAALAALERSILRAEKALVAAAQAERSRWLSRIEQFRSKARERVQ